MVRSNRNQSTTADLRISLEIGPGSTVGTDMMRTLYEASARVVEVEEEAAAP